jgi:hypothetical protein
MILWRGAVPDDCIVAEEGDAFHAFKSGPVLEGGAEIEYRLLPPLPMIAMSTGASFSTIFVSVVVLGPHHDRRPCPLAQLLTVEARTIEDLTRIVNPTMSGPKSLSSFFLSTPSICPLQSNSRVWIEFSRRNAPMHMMPKGALL